MVSTGPRSGVDKIPMQEEYENDLESDMDLDNKIIKLGDLNQLACENLILPISTNSSMGYIAFRLVRNAKTLEFLERNCNIVWAGWK